MERGALITEVTVINSEQQVKRKLGHLEQNDVFLQH